MIAAGWRRLGISPGAWIVLAMAVLALLLSRGAGSGWLVVITAGFLGVLGVSIAWALIGLCALRVTLDAPSDASAGEPMSIGITVTAPIRQLRTVEFRGLDKSRHAVAGRAPTIVRVEAGRRTLLMTLAVEVRTGLPLGLVRPSRRFRVVLPTPLAIAPVPATASLVAALGEDPESHVRSIRDYLPGDSARLVHWRTTARRGELMVREFESADLLRGRDLNLRVTLPSDTTSGDAIAARAAGLAIAALDAGMKVTLLTCDERGPLQGVVRSRREVGRALAAAVDGEPPSASGDGPVVEVAAP